MQISQKVRTWAVRVLLLVLTVLYPFLFLGKAALSFLYGQADVCRRIVQEMARELRGLKRSWPTLWREAHRVTFRNPLAELLDYFRGRLWGRRVLIVLAVPVLPLVVLWHILRLYAELTWDILRDIPTLPASIGDVLADIWRGEA